jgi:hypothetical protein
MINVVGKTANVLVAVATIQNVMAALRLVRLAH